MQTRKVSFRRVLRYIDDYFSVRMLSGKSLLKCNERHQHNDNFLSRPIKKLRKDTLAVEKCNSLIGYSIWIAPEKKMKKSKKIEPARPINYAELQKLYSHKLLHEIRKTPRNVALKGNTCLLCAERDANTRICHGSIGGANPCELEANVCFVCISKWIVHGQKKCPFCRHGFTEKDLILEVPNE